MPRYDPKTDTWRCASCSKRAGHDVYKPISEFYIDKVAALAGDLRPQGSYCVECRKSMSSTWQKDHRAEAREKAELLMAKMTSDLLHMVLDDEKVEYMVQNCNSAQVGRLMEGRAVHPDIALVALRDILTREGKLTADPRLDNGPPGF